MMLYVREMKNWNFTGGKRGWKYEFWQIHILLSGGRTLLKTLQIKDSEKIISISQMRRVGRGTGKKII